MPTYWGYDYRPYGTKNSDNSLTKKQKNKKRNKKAAKKARKLNRL